jgi:hypothetical protein
MMQKPLQSVAASMAVVAIGIGCIQIARHPDLPAPIAGGILTAGSSTSFVSHIAIKNTLLPGYSVALPPYAFRATHQSA